MSNNQQASQLTWNQIKKYWFYDDLLLGKLLSNPKTFFNTIRNPNSKYENGF